MEGAVESTVLVVGRFSEEGMEQNGTLMAYVDLSLSPNSQPPAVFSGYRIAT